MINPNWRGHLTIQNVEEVAAMVHQILADHTYTTIKVSQEKGYRPVVRVGQSLQGVYPHPHNSNHAWFTVRDSRDWNFSTQAHAGTEFSPTISSLVEFSPRQINIEYYVDGYHTIWSAVIES